jgi:hypothetical protein
LLLHAFEPLYNRERGNEIDANQDQQKGVRKGPRHAKAFSGPEGAKGRQHDANDEFERIFWHLRQRSAYQGTHNNHKQASKHSTQRGGSDAVQASICGCDFEPLQAEQNAEAEEIRQELDKIRRWYDRAVERDWFGTARREEALQSIERCEKLLEEFEEKAHRSTISHKRSCVAYLALSWAAVRMRSATLRG